MKICNLPQVREYAGTGEVELWFNEATGTLGIKAYNEGGYNNTIVDLNDIMNWLDAGGREQVAAALKQNER